MKTSLILLAAATLTPALMLVGLGASATFGLVSIIGVSSILIQDYGTKSSYQSAPAMVRAARTESHPLAA